MKKLILFGIAVIALVASAWHIGYAQAQLADFHITVTPSATGLEATCEQGCAWKTITSTCGTKNHPIPKGTSCDIVIDQTGVGGK